MVPPNLKEQSGQLAIEGDAVEHLDDTVVREVGVLSVALEELSKGRAHASGRKSLYEAFKVESLKQIKTRVITY